MESRYKKLVREEGMLHKTRKSKERTDQNLESQREVSLTFRLNSYSTRWPRLADQKPIGSKELIY